jgi:hypothetical protein
MAFFPLATRATLAQESFLLWSKVVSGGKTSYTPTKGAYVLHLKESFCINV